MPEQDGTSAGTPKSRGIEDLPTRRETDKGVSVEVRLVTQISSIALLVWCVPTLQLFTFITELTHEIRIKTDPQYMLREEGGKDTLEE